MNRIIIALLLPLLTGGWGAASMGQHSNGSLVTGGGGGGGSCTWGSGDSAFFDSTAISGSGNQILAASDAGMQFTLASESTITGYKANLSDLDSVGSVTASLYTDNSDSIGTIISDTTVTVSNSSVSDTPTFGVVTFTLATPKANVAAGTYWVVLESVSSAAMETKYTSGAYRIYGEAFAGYADDQALGFGVWGCSE